MTTPLRHVEALMTAIYGNPSPLSLSLWPVDLCTGKALVTGIHRALATLPAREAQVIRLRFGLTGDLPKTLRAIAPFIARQKRGNHGETGVLSREAVRQLEVRALRALRRPDRQRNFRIFCPGSLMARWRLRGRVSLC